MLQKRIASAIATGALLLNLATPAYAGTITISGNGDSSDNDANVSVTQSTTVVQNNTANVYNKVDADADTGNNDANRNTGGDVSIDTGNASTNVTVNNTLNSNSASIDCCPTNGNTTINISGNGVDSKNNVDLNSTSNQNIFQDNNARVYNKVDTDADTGDNDANRNTGGNVSITTGDAETTVNVSTAANVNHATIGGNGGNGGSLSAWIVGNGDSSDNDIDVNLTANQAITQDNYAYVKNKVDADADTGNNDANRNTGGNVTIDTGDATVDVSVDNMLNFNHANLDCGCLLDDWDLKIGGNGVDSYNDINLTLEDGRKNGVFQDNDAYLKNKVKDLDADTGDNDANRNTGQPDGDPSVTTGNAGVTVAVNNSLNVNSVGGEAPEWDFPGGSVHFSFDLGDLLDWLTSHMN